MDPFVQRRMIKIYILHYLIKLQYYLPISPLHNDYFWGNNHQALEIDSEISKNIKMVQLKNILYFPKYLGQQLDGHVLVEDGWEWIDTINRAIWVPSQLFVKMGLLRSGDAVM